MLTDAGSLRCDRETAYHRLLTCVSSYQCMCGLMLLCLCPHTTTGEATALRRQVQEASELLRHERAQHASERQVLTYADVC